MPQVPALFGIDPETADDIFVGYHDPSIRWNGWATPAFARSEAERVIAWINRTADKFGTDDQYRAHMADGVVIITQPDEPNYSERYAPDADGRFAIGAFGWTWQEVALPPEIDRLREPERITAFLQENLEESRVWCAVANAVNHALVVTGDYSLRRLAQDAAARAAVEQYRQGKPRTTPTLKGDD